MALTDPQTLTIAGSANTLPRVSSGDNKGSFRKDDSTVKIEVSHAYGARNRRLVKFTQTKVAPDPLIASTNIIYSQSINVVLDSPLTGFTVTEQKDFVAAMNLWFTTGTNANTIKILGGEN